MTLSEASSKSSDVTCFWFLRAAKIAASLHKLAISAPLKPGVKVASLLAYSSIYTEGSNLIGFK